MGEAKRRGIAAVQEAFVTMSVEATGTRMQVHWNQREAATPFGQMAYFAEFLNLTGHYRRWCAEIVARAESRPWRRSRRAAPITCSSCD